MFEILLMMRQDAVTVQGFLLEYFLYEGFVHTSECPTWKKTENLGGKFRKNN